MDPDKADEERFKKRLKKSSFQFGWTSWVALAFITPWPSFGLALWGFPYAMFMSAGVSFYAAYLCRRNSVHAGRAFGPPTAWVSVLGVPFRIRGRQGIQFILFGIGQIPLGVIFMVIELTRP